MNTITISKKEYNALVFAKANIVNRKSQGKLPFFEAGFGVLKKSFGRIGSTAFVNKIRKSWRE
jgi:hypothetical protein